MCVDVNGHVIINEGMKSIHKAIWKPKTDSALVSEQIEEVAKEISGPCKFLCGHQVTNNFLGKQHVFIDTDFLGQNIPTLEEGYENKRHALRDMPLHLKFAGKLYYLFGIVEYHPGHYVAYVRKKFSGSWNLHDDLAH
ncbi:hypothetical protein J6590_106058 [Homalodisca vitripennis]|nr:hypothetical protein J6590_106058 [Homalodisca vitripennis]